MPEEDLDEGDAVVKACVQKKQIALLEALDELVNEFMFRSACLAVDEVQGGAADQIKEATKLDRITISNTDLCQAKKRGIVKK
jgi:hypothetical protein